MEDRGDLARLLIEALNHLNPDLEVTWVKNGDDGKEMLSEHRYNLVIADLTMPRTFLREKTKPTGMVLTEMIRAGDFLKNRHTPVIVQSDFAQATTAQQRRMFAARKVTFMHKFDLFDIYGAKRNYTAESRAKEILDCLEVLGLDKSLNSNKQMQFQGV